MIQTLTLCCVAVLSRYILGELRGGHIHSDHVCPLGTVPRGRRSDAGTEESPLRDTVGEGEGHIYIIIL